MKVAAHVVERGSTPLASGPLQRMFRLLLGVLIAATGLMWFSGSPVAAHTGFDSSTPSDGAVVDDPIRLVTLVFTGEANPAGDQFVALDASGQLQSPASVTTLDNKIFSLSFDPPLGGGEIGIRWTVQAADAHPISGAFSFTVNSPVATTVAPVIEAEPTIDESLGIEDDAPTDVTPLEEFLAVDEQRPGDTLSTFGRLIGLTGVTLGLGALAFAATALRGTRDEFDFATLGVRLFGALVVVGALIEYVGISRITNESVATAWSTSSGFGSLLRVAGGVALAVGTSIVASPIGRRPAQSLSSASTAVSELRSSESSKLYRWTPDGSSRVAYVGVVLIIVSFWFDGHTVNKGIRPIHALANSVHVIAGSVWVGGVVAMAALMWFRHRAGRPMRAMQLVIRFSAVASVALAAVVVAGVVMAILVLDSFGELTSTQWGKMLLLKTAAVGLTTMGGAYNHFRLLPALNSDPENPELADELRSIVTAEAIMLLFVVAVTAWLVTAAT